MKGYFYIVDGEPYVNPKQKPSWDMEGFKPNNKTVADWEKNLIEVENGTYTKDDKTIIALPPDSHTKLIKPGQLLTYKKSGKKCVITKIN